MLNLDANGIALVSLAVSTLGLAGQLLNVLLKLSITSRIAELENTLKDYVGEKFVLKETCEARHEGLQALEAARGR